MRLQRRLAGPHHLERPHHIHRVNAGEILRAQPIQLMMGDEFGGAGIVHQNVDPAPRIQRGLRQILAIGVFGHIGLHQPHIGACRLHRVGGFLRRVRAARIIHHHIGAAFGQPDGGRRPDAGG